MREKRWVVTEVTSVDAPDSGTAIDRVVSGSKEGSQDVIEQRATSATHYASSIDVADGIIDAVEHLKAALRNLESAHATIEVELGRVTGISPELDNVSHHIQETFTALGLDQPNLEE